jgi:hypothetical protein
VQRFTDVTYSKPIIAEPMQWPVPDLATRFNFRQRQRICCLLLRTDAVEKEKYSFLLPEVKARFLDGTPRRLPTLPTALCRLPFDCTTLTVTSTVYVQLKLKTMSEVHFLCKQQFFFVFINQQSQYEVFYKLMCWLGV